MSDEVKKRVHLPRWREDFPIRWEDDHYVTRRELARFLTLGSALLVGANAALAVAGRAGPVPVYETKRIAAADALANGESLLFRYPTKDDPCILIRTKSGALVAFSQVCTHLSCAVVYRAADDRLFCPCHNGLFECGEGKGGALPLEGPPERPLPRVALVVRDNDVYATGMVS
ncbi:MAG: Rieske 2Fe-2S domain-containing protein [Polyangiaceae bacterium]